MASAPAPLSSTPSLYVVATPLGNLRDISLRALDVLGAVDLIAAEDTRHSQRLLDAHGIRTRLVAAHQHNEERAAAQICDHLAAGRQVALISDAGTPAVSDPGARIVARVQQAGHPVVPLPGPSAAVAALSVSGLADDRFMFCGFLPAKPAGRRAALASLRAVPAALVFYEAPHRIREAVEDLAAVLEPEREIVFARELTKRFEQIRRMPLTEAQAWLAEDDNRCRGEFVLVVSGPPPAAGVSVEAERVLTLLLAELPVKGAARLAADITGGSRNQLYQRALELKSGAAPPPPGGL